MAARNAKPTSDAAADAAQDAVAPAMDADGSCLLSVRGDLFKDAALASIESRALAYLQAGVPVHFRGPAGTGKTTLAKQLAALIGRPTVLLTGDGWFTASHLVGDVVGHKTSSVHDRYIHSVTKKESATSEVWEDRALTLAMEKGYTLVYDEFTRSPPEANNPLLSALEERALVLATGARENRLVRAAPEFRAIFTSNPSDYAAVKAPQDALLDRMITFDLEWHDASTEIGILRARSGLDAERAGAIVTLVRALRAQSAAGAPPTTRTAITIAKIVRHQNIRPSADDERFVQLCFDVLESRAPVDGRGRAERDAYFDTLHAMIRSACAAEGGAKRAGGARRAA